MKFDAQLPRGPFEAWKVTIVLDEIDLSRSKIPKAVRQWYESSKDHKISDELFYLSEIVKGLGE